MEGSRNYYITRMDVTPVIPVLMSETSRLAKPMDIIRYLLRGYMSLPKGINDTFSDMEASFVADNAAVGYDPQLLSEKASSSLRSLLSRYFTNNSSIEVDVTYEKLDEVYYSLKFDIMVVVDGKVYSFTSDNYRVDKNGKLVYEFDPS